jgi:hypothetical protein
MEIITWHYIFIIIVFICNYEIVNSCYIWGTDSGICDVRGEDALWRGENMPYCVDAVNYPVCLPKPQVYISNYKCYYLIYILIH